MLLTCKVSALLRLQGSVTPCVTGCAERVVVGGIPGPEAKRLAPVEISGELMFRVAPVAPVASLLTAFQAGILASTAALRSDTPMRHRVAAPRGGVARMRHGERNMHVQTSA